jgi:heavy metal translocating P-type ATPase
MIYAGTLNLDGAVVAESTSDPDSGSLERLICAVRKARESKGYYQELADRVSVWVFPAVAVVAMATLTWHWRLSGFDHGLSAALAVVLVACPCALGLATPLAAWTALGVAARHHVLFRDGQALERLAGIRAVRFDKTGTLTTGDARVVSCVVDEIPEMPAGSRILSLVAKLTDGSLHPFSLAIHEYCSMHSTAQGEKLADVRQLAGRGLAGRSVETGEPVLLGSRAFMEEFQLAIPKSLHSAIMAGEVGGCSVVCAGCNRQVRAVYLIEETLRNSTAQAISQCREMGLHVAVLTGDHRGCARRLETELGVPVIAELMPEQKLGAIREAQERFGPVTMVGDGVNDAPALAASDVGVALGCGADVSRDAAQVCLLSDDPSCLVWAIQFARKTVRIMRRNLIWAFIYNGAGIALAVSGRLNPALAALLMVVSSVLVVRNSLSLSGAPGELSLPHQEHEAATPRVVSEPQLPTVPA